ncbi:dual oxidase [Acrasis kona]|uniref:Dual oxidase n=1 Tax=Acrasis kona TaxID=1008807 RepID=A0AAW2ZRE1_9EUKA
MKTVSQQVLSKTTVAKLKEIKRQREFLEKHYDDVLSDADKQSSKQRELGVLHEGIKKVKDHHKHFRDIDYVELQMKRPCFYGGDGISRWTVKLRKEIKNGRRRQFQTKLFCSVLEEWLRNTTEESSWVEVTSEKVVKENNSKLTELIDAAFATPNKDYTESTLEAFSKIFNDYELSSIVHYTSTKDDALKQKVTKKEVVAAIKNSIIKGLITNATTSRELQILCDDDLTVGELSDLMSIKL